MQKILQGNRSYILKKDRKNIERECQRPKKLVFSFSKKETLKTTVELEKKGRRLAKCPSSNRTGRVPFFTFIQWENIFVTKTLKAGTLFSLILVHEASVAT